MKEPVKGTSDQGMRWVHAYKRKSLRVDDISRPKNKSLSLDKGSLRVVVGMPTKHNGLMHNRSKMGFKECVVIRLKLQNISSATAPLWQIWATGLSSGMILKITEKAQHNENGFRANNNWQPNGTENCFYILPLVVTNNV